MILGGLSTTDERADMFDVACDVMFWSPLVEYHSARLSESATSLVSACEVSGVAHGTGVLALSVVEMVNVVNEPGLNLGSF